MSEKLIIKNFGPIKKMEIDLAKVLILIGPQSTGKSTIAKLVTIFRSFSFISREEVFEEELINYGIDSFLDKGTFIQYSSTSYSFFYQNQESNFKPNEGHRLSKLLNEFKVPKEQQLLEITQSDLTNQLKNEVLKFTNYSIYIPAERLFISMVANSIMSLIKNKAPIPDLLLEFGAAFEKARKNLGSYKIDFLNISYKHVNNQDRVYLNQRKHIELSKASSGLQALIPLLMVIQDNLKNTTGGNTYVIEEPELNLYPEAQYELSKIISSICSASNPEYERHNELVITTHSPYILTAFNNFLLANKLGNEKQMEAIDTILPKDVWVAQSDFNAYYVDGKKATQIFNKETGLIADNQLDEASEVIMGDFEDLMNLYSNKLLNGHAN